MDKELVRNQRYELKVYIIHTSSGKELNPAEV